MDHDCSANGRNCMAVDRPLLSVAGYLPACRLTSQGTGEGSRASTELDPISLGSSIVARYRLGRSNGKTMEGVLSGSSARAGFSMQDQPWDSGARSDRSGRELDTSRADGAISTRGPAPLSGGGRSLLVPQRHNSR